MTTKQGSLLGGILLVAGTAIGGGMLALPVLTGEGGFVPTTILYLLSWLFMMATGLLLLEVFLWDSRDMNLVSMAEKTLSTPGKILAWALYLFLFSCLLVAYISGGGALAGDVCAFLSSGYLLPKWIGPLLFVLCFAPFVIFGPHATGRINALLMGGLIFCFILFVCLGTPHIQYSALLRSNWSRALLATPVIFTSFGFQGVIPTLANYLGRRPHAIRKAIIWGSTIPLLTYILWEALILGVVPVERLQQAAQEGATAVSPLRHILHLPWLFAIGESFAFFAIVTSFLGVSLGFIDFLFDGLKIEKRPINRLLLSLLIFIPPLVFSTFHPDIFLQALRYAGGIGCALLLGLLPILMVWRGRYRLHFSSPYSLWGGRITLLCLILFVLFELMQMVAKIR